MQLINLWTKGNVSALDGIRGSIYLTMKNLIIVSWSHALKITFNGVTAIYLSRLFVRQNSLIKTWRQAPSLNQIVYINNSSWLSIYNINMYVLKFHFHSLENFPTIKSQIWSLPSWSILKNVFYGSTTLYLVWIPIHYS